MGRIEQCGGTTRAPYEVLPGAIPAVSLFLRLAGSGVRGQVKPAVGGHITSAGTLFQKGKCKAKEDKPTACAMYPIGRYYDAVDDRFYYYRTEMCDRDENGDKWVLEDWLEVNGIFETEEISLAWCHALTNIVKETSRLDHDRLSSYEFLYTVINGTMYYNYYNQEPYFKEPYIKKFRDQMDGLEYFLETYWRKYN